MISESKIKGREHKGHIRAKLIHDIIEHSKMAHEMFGVQVRKFDELYKMKANDLKNIDAELRIQIGIKRKSFAY